MSTQRGKPQKLDHIPRSGCSLEELTCCHFAHFDYKSHWRNAGGSRVCSSPDQRTGYSLESCSHRSRDKGRHHTRHHRQARSTSPESIFSWNNSVCLHTNILPKIFQSGCNVHEQKSLVRVVLLEEVLTEISIPIHPLWVTHPIHPLIAFEHLSLYIQKHLGVATRNSKLDKNFSFREYLCRTQGNSSRLYGKHWEMSAMIDFTKEMPQNTTVIQSEYTEQCSKSSNDSAILRQSMISRVDNNK